ncbi:MAG: hypothetical protein MJZ16_03185 [Bacteroidales bacterium]|nr:hypothetical protein [Bacteroidales bacterium]
MKVLTKLLIILFLCSFVSCKKEEPQIIDLSGGVEAIDLGLKDLHGKPIKWAIMNIGAKNDADFGSYFAWGETAEKSNYSWDNPGEYKWGTKIHGMTKYTSDRYLEPSDDAATAMWGNKWRTPSLYDILEFTDQDKCEWTWTTRTNSDGKEVKGYLVTSKIDGYKGNSIFLPAAGYRKGTETELIGLGSYWLSTKMHGKDSEADMIHFSFKYSKVIGFAISDRYLGFPVRAVTEY